MPTRSAPLHTTAAFTLGLGLAACGGSSDDLAPYTLDTRAEGGGGGAALVAYEADGAWKAAPVVSPGVFSFTPSGPTIAYAVVCDDAATFAQVTIRLDALSDDRTLSHPCEAREVAASHVGAVPATARIGIGRSTYVQNLGEASREVQVAGIHDVVAYTDERIALRRGVTFPLAAPLLLDVDAEGVELERHPLTPPAIEDGEQLTVSYWFRTAGGTSVRSLLPGDGAEVAGVVPASLLAGGDEHRVTVDAYRDRTYRAVTVRGPVMTDLPLGSLALPDTITAAASWDDRPELRWKGDGADQVDLTVSQATEDVLRFWYATASAGWLIETEQSERGSWRMPDLSAVPGWKPAWSLDRDLAASSDWSVDAIVLESDRVLTAGSSGTLGDAP